MHWDERQCPGFRLIISMLLCDVLIVLIQGLYYIRVNIASPILSACEQFFLCLQVEFTFNLFLRGQKFMYPLTCTYANKIFIKYCDYCTFFCCCSCNYSMQLCMYNQWSLCLSAHVQVRYTVICLFVYRLFVCVQQVLLLNACNTILCKYLWWQKLNYNFLIFQL